MSDNREFYRIRVGSRTFIGQVDKGRLWVQEKGPMPVSAEIGRAEVIHTGTGSRHGPARGYLAKYGNDFERKIDLTFAREEEQATLLEAFGFRERPYEEYLQPQGFYESPAFKGLCNWVVAHPRLAKREGAAAPEDTYVRDWFARCVEFNQ